MNKPCTFCRAGLVCYNLRLAASAPVSAAGAATAAGRSAHARPASTHRAIKCRTVHTGRTAHGGLPTTGGTAHVRPAHAGLSAAGGTAHVRTVHTGLSAAGRTVHAGTITRMCVGGATMVAVRCYSRTPGVAMRCRTMVTARVTARVTAGAAVVSGGTVAGMMPGGVMMRTVRAVHMVRVAPTARIPRGRAPCRYHTGDGQPAEAVNGHTVGIIPVHGSPVIISVNREAGSVIAGSCPRHAAVHIHGTCAACCHDSVRPRRHET